MEAEVAEVDAALYEVLAAFSEAADSVQTPWLVIGATARIMLLENVYGWPPGLGTQDVDFGVQVGDWDHYKQLCDYITKNDVFEAERKPTKRFVSKDNMVFDLVPYGGVEDDKRQVFWPPHNDDVMTVRGFESAGKDAVPVLVNQKLTVPVISPGGLCALKFFAWEERHTQHPGRDAKDIAYLFKNIGSLYSPETLFNKYLNAVETADYQIQSAGHYQLGCNVAVLMSGDDCRFLISFISEELEKNEDSDLCRELHQYTNMASLEETKMALEFFYRGLCSR
jgi:predicted nucleotidyltransferase